MAATTRLVIRWVSAPLSDAVILTMYMQDKYGKHFCRRSYACSQLASTFYASSNVQPKTPTSPLASAASMFAAMSQEERNQVSVSLYECNYYMTLVT